MTIAFVGNVLQDLQRQFPVEVFARRRNRRSLRIIPVAPFPRNAAVRHLPDPYHREERPDDVMGVVDSEMDRRMAEIRAREVSGVFSVKNELVVDSR